MSERTLTMAAAISEAIAQAMAHSALHRRESRGSHQRLDGFGERDDANFLKHTMAHYAGEGVAPLISYADVTITRSQPGTRAYGAAGDVEEARFCTVVARRP